MQFLNNVVIAALVGAFVAYMLVAATDLRRRYRYKRLLSKLILHNRDHAKRKLEIVRVNAALLREGNQVADIDAPIMPFSTQSIRDYQFQVLDILKAQEAQGLDVLLYWMHAIDDLTDDLLGLAAQLKELTEEGTSHQKLNALSTRYLDQLDEAERDLKYFINLAGFYVEGKPELILQFQQKA